MSTYRKIHGRSIQAVTTDPSETVAEGQIWYNTGSDTFKTVVALEAWSSAAPLSVARDKPGAAGTQTASLAIGGETALTSVDEYDGTGWKSAPAINTGRHGVASGGTTSAAWKAGGSPPETTTATEEYDGSSWTTVPGTLNTGRYILGSCGTQTAGLCNGGYNTANVNNSEEYDGSSWTNGNAMNTARRTCADIGIQTAAVSFGGQPPAGPAQDDVEEYDGTSWTTVGNYPTNISDSAGSGTLTAGLAFGGNVPPSTTATKNYDGTTWTANPASLGTAAKRHGGTPSGTNAAAIAFGGDGPGSNTNIAQEFNKSANVITAGAFASLPNLNTARWGLGGAGTKSAGIVFGGRNPSVAQNLALTEEYSGASWSEGPDLGQARRVCGRGTGTQTAALAHGGHYGSPSTRYKVAEEFDGSSWTNGGTSTNAHDGTANLGTLTSAASCGGYDGTNLNKTEEYDGTSFSTANDMPYAAYQLAASGSQTAGFVFGGGYPSVTTSANYDGTNWTSGPALIQATLAHAGNGGGGTQTEAIGAAGYRSSPAAYLNNSFTYDGTNFTTGPSVGTARSELAGQGANSSFYIAGGLLPPGSASNAAEEFTAETTALNVKTLTQS
jgi:hypothetical protein